MHSFGTGAGYRTADPKRDEDIKEQLGMTHK